MNAYFRMRQARDAYMRSNYDADLFNTYMVRRDEWLMGSKRRRSYGLVALISCAVTALAFTGCALAYQAQSEAPRLVCSSAMPASEADFTELHEFGKSDSTGYYKELVSIGCKVNPQGTR